MSEAIIEYKIRKHIDIKKLKKEVAKKWATAKKKSEKKSKSSIIKGLSKKLSYKRSKTPRPTLTIPEYKAESAWDEPSVFFKNELEETKKSLFFK